MTGQERVVYVCEKCGKDGVPRRTFLSPNDPVPRCPEHHSRMTVQERNPYLGRKR